MGLKEAIRSREPLAGNWLTFGEPGVAEISAALGFDFVAIDAEHTSHTLETIAHMIRATESVEGPTVPLVRVEWNDLVVIKRVLDVGAAGVIVPMVETGEEAEHIAEAVRYPPEGRRGVAGSRASDWGMNMGEYVETADDRVVALAQIENERGVANAGDIAAVDAIDGVFVGPADLSVSLGAFGEWESDRFRDAVSTVIEDVHAEGKAVGALAITPEQIRNWVEWGADFVAVGTDKAAVAAGARESLRAYEDARE